MGKLHDWVAKAKKKANSHEFMVHKANEFFAHTIMTLFKYAIEPRLCYCWN